MITTDEIRKLALAMPEAVESSHFDVADFRIRKKIFATIHPTGKTGVLLHIDPDQRAALVENDPETYQLRGTALQVVFARVKKAEYKALLEQAWLNTAPASYRRPSAASSPRPSGAGAARAPARRARGTRRRAQ